MTQSPSIQPVRLLQIEVVEAENHRAILQLSVQRHGTIPVELDHLTIAALRRGLTTAERILSQGSTSH